jgi:hypothetical protein
MRFCPKLKYVKKCISVDTAKIQYFLVKPRLELYTTVGLLITAPKPHVVIDDGKHKMMPTLPNNGQLALWLDVSAMPSLLPSVWDRDILWPRYYKRISDSIDRWNRSYDFVCPGPLAKAAATQRTTFLSTVVYGGQQLIKFGKFFPQTRDKHSLFMHLSLFFFWKEDS